MNQQDNCPSATGPNKLHVWKKGIVLSGGKPVETCEHCGVPKLGDVLVVGSDGKVKSLPSTQGTKTEPPPPPEGRMSPIEYLEQGHLYLCQQNEAIGMLLVEQAKAIAALKRQMGVNTPCPKA